MTAELSGEDLFQKELKDLRDELLKDSKDSITALKALCHHADPSLRLEAIKYRFKLLGLEIDQKKMELTGKDGKALGVIVLPPLMED